MAFWLGSPESATGYASGYGGGIGQNFIRRGYDGNWDSWTTIGTGTDTFPVQARAPHYADARGTVGPVRRGGSS